MQPMFDANNTIIGKFPGKLISRWIYFNYLGTATAINFTITAAMVWKPHFSMNEWVSQSAALWILSTRLIWGHFNMRCIFDVAPCDSFWTNFQYVVYSNLTRIDGMQWTGTRNRVNLCARLVCHGFNFTQMISIIRAAAKHTRCPYMHKRGERARWGCLEIATNNTIKVSFELSGWAQLTELYTSTYITQRSGNHFDWLASVDGRRKKAGRIWMNQVGRGQFQLKVYLFKLLFLSIYS